MQDLCLIVLVIKSIELYNNVLVLKPIIDLVIFLAKR
jgi:hypothetical protein